MGKGIKWSRARTRFSAGAASRVDDTPLEFGDAHAAWERRQAALKAAAEKKAKPKKSDL